MIIITSSAWFVKLDVGFEYISIISYYDRADSVLALAGKYSRIHVRQWVPVKHVFNSIFTGTPNAMHMDKAFPMDWKTHKF